MGPYRVVSFTTNERQLVDQKEIISIVGIDKQKRSLDAIWKDCDPYHSICISEELYKNYVPIEMRNYLEDQMKIKKIET